MNFLKKKNIFGLKSPYFIAEIGVNHGCSMSLAKKQILLAKKNGGSYEGIGNSVALSGRDINGTTSVTLTAAHIEGVDSGVTEGDVLTFKAKIYDAAGNHTTGNAFGTTLQNKIFSIFLISFIKKLNLMFKFRGFIFFVGKLTLFLILSFESTKKILVSELPISPKIYIYL